MPFTATRSYSYAVTELHDSDGAFGSGLAFTLGEGNDLVCRAAEFLARDLPGHDIEELMGVFGAWQRAASNEQQLRWLGPHKGVVHLALASVTNACWDLWARMRNVPLWQLLLDLPTDTLLSTLDFSYIEDVLPIAEAIAPGRVAAGEHVPNRLVFKNYFQAKAMAFCQVDAVRVAGVSEFLVISLLAR